MSSSATSNIVESMLGSVFEIILRGEPGSVDVAN